MILIEEAEEDVGVSLWLYAHLSVSLGTEGNLTGIAALYLKVPCHTKIASYWLPIANDRRAAVNYSFLVNG